MMTSVIFRGFLVTSTVVGLWGSHSAEARSVKRVGPAMLAWYADSIVIIRVEELWQAEARFEGTVVGSIRGEIEEGERISVIYPVPDLQEKWLFDRQPLEVGVCLLAFLIEKRGEDWWPLGSSTASVPWESRNSTWREKARRARGGQGFIRVECEEALEVSRLFGRFMEWDRMEIEERSGLMAESLRSDSRSMRWIALKWITLDRKVRLSNPEEATDGVAEGLVSCATDSDLEIRRMALRAITTTTAARKDLVPYLVDMLGDDAVKAIAVSGLEWRIMRKGDGPTVSATAEIDVKVQAWKDWWKEKGRDAPEFKRFVPSAGGEAEPPPDSPGE